MKYLLSILLLTLACFSAKAQMTLEHTYSNYSVTTVEIENEGLKYVAYDTTAKKIKLYNSNHSVWKTINYTLPPLTNPNTYCVSTKFFNNDSKVELIIYYVDFTTGNAVYFCKLINEDGSILKDLPGASGIRAIKDGKDWKVITMRYDAYKSDVYSVPGSMPQQSTGMKPDASSEGSSTNLYPNPMDNVATLAYSLPAGVHEGTIHIYNAAGQQVRSYNISSQFSNILVSRGELPPGHYTYQVTAQNAAPVSRMFIIQ